MSNVELGWERPRSPVRVVRWVMALAALAAVPAMALRATPPATNAQAPVQTVTATAAGGQTLDRDAQGGNPFATALVRTLQEPNLPLGEFLKRLQLRTHQLSNGFQTPDLAGAAGARASVLAGDKAAPRRRAMVLVFADYGPASGLEPLPGALFDAYRLFQALQAAGFETSVVANPTRESLAADLDQFARESARYDVALIYTTGHGAEVDGVGYLLPTDFPLKAGKSALGASAVPLKRIAASLRARHANLLFYGGCRDNLFLQQ